MLVFCFADSPTRSSEVSLTFNGLHSVISQKTELFEKIVTLYCLKYLSPVHNYYFASFFLWPSFLPIFSFSLFWPIIFCFFLPLYLFHLGRIL
jgi:hypothetical protein